MEFTEYRSFNDQLESNFGWAFEEYPYAMYVLEHALRSRCAGRKNLSQSIMKRSTRYNVASNVYRNYIANISEWVEGDKVPRALISLPSFRGLQNIFEQDAHTRGVIAKNALGGGWSHLVDFMLLNRIPIFGCCRGGQSFRRIMSRIMTVGLLKGLTKNDIMFKLDGVVRERFRQLQNILMNLNVRYIIAPGDSTPSARLVCEAAKSLDIRFIVVAHGYIQDPKLISIAPVRADVLLAWSNKQRNDLRRVLDVEQAKKVKFIGYPKITNKQNGQSSEATDALFICEPMSDFLMEKGYRESLRHTIEQCRSAGLPVRVRLHPKERENDEVRRMVEEFGGLLSDCDLDSAFESARIIFGSNSSALVEAAFHGKPTYQIAEMKRFDFEGVREVSATSVADVCKSLESVDDWVYPSEISEVGRAEVETLMDEVL